jgi:hypothetical protein
MQPENIKRKIELEKAFADHTWLGRYEDKDIQTLWEEYSHLCSSQVQQKKEGDSPKNT